MKPELEQELRIIQGRIDAAKEELAAIQGQENEARAGVRDAEIELTGVRNAITANRAQNDDHEALRKGNEAALLELDAVLTQKRAALTALEARQLELIAAIEQYEHSKGQRESLEGARIAALFEGETRALAAVQAERRTEEATVAQLGAEAAQLTLTLESAERASRESVRALEERKTGLEGDVAALAVEVAGLEAKIVAATAEQQALQKALQGSQAAADGAKGDAIEFDRQARLLEAQAADLATQLRALTATYEGKKKEYAAAEVRFQALTRREVEADAREAFIKAKFKELGIDYR